MGIGLVTCLEEGKNRGKSRGQGNEISPFDAADWMIAHGCLKLPIIKRNGGAVGLLYV